MTCISSNHRGRVDLCSDIRTLGTLKILTKLVMVNQLKTLPLALGDDAHINNGCLWVIPGSHQKGVIDHHDAEITERLPVRHRAAVTDEMEQQAIPLEVPRGTIVYFNNALLHQSTPNRSDAFRRAYVVHYMKVSIQHTGQGTRMMGERAAGLWKPTLAASNFLLRQHSKPRA
jgi:ectoine hydroxylase-related dioxygenase (phytanoyl-CoA dioxygenase family)